ncbi:DNA recombination protein RmuC [Pseudothermotoga elfii]
MSFFLVILGMFLGFVGGYIIGQAAAKNEGQKDIQSSLKPLLEQLSELSRQQGSFSSHLNTLNNLSGLVADLKARYEEIKESEKKLSLERDKRMEDFMENMRHAFEEVSSKMLKIDEEKEKRIMELVENMKRFTDEQRASTEKFLSQQGTTREEIEKRRDAELKDMRKIMENFIHTISGTKTRGNVGEMLLSDALSETIKTGTVVKNLSVGSMTVEFAWNLGDGKYIPIDSKFPEIFSLAEEYEEKPENREQLKKQIVQKIMKEIENIKKYCNQPNTIDSCIMVVPSTVLDIAPELVAIGKEHNVFLCSYREIFAVAHYLEARYFSTKQDEAGKYRRMVEDLLKLLGDIEKKIASVDRALKSISNASNDIKTLTSKGKSIASGDFVSTQMNRADEIAETSEDAEQNIERG